jgi:beta-lactam-binding protein with PASTA domain
MSLFRFLFSKALVKNIVLAFIVFFIGVFIVQYRLNHITLHGEEIGVPDFRGYQVDKVQELVERKKLRMTIADSLYDRNLEAGAIIQQSPEPGSMVKENRRIYFTINSHSPPIVKIPPLIDQSKRQALATLTILELEADTISYKVSMYDGLVLDVLYKGRSIAEGAELPLGSSVHLIIGESSDLPRVLMPDILGSSMRQIDSILNAYSLNIGMIIDCIDCENEEDSLNAIVIKTYPQYKTNKRVRMGSSVDISLTTYENDSLITIE